VDVTAFDPNMPDPEVVAAARARRPDPVAAIKADVASRLATKVKPAGGAPAAGAPALASSATGSQRPTASAMATKRATGGGETAAAGVPASRRSEATPQAKQRLEGAPATSTASGQEAAARVKASQEYQEARERVEDSARGAAGATPRSGLATLTSPTVRAASFPAAVPEDN
jgi:conjugal transfer pilus assembly protein TraV